MPLNPILKVLSVLHGCRVRFLLMGGQACVLYGGSEFSRDTDVIILPDQGNLDRLREALAALQAEPIAVPQLSIENLQKGHAIHFRCGHPEALDMRIDIMAVLRNTPSFDILWSRRTTLEIGDGVTVDAVSLPDLVAIKKTQRDKDWTHIRRLVEADYFEHGEKATSAQARFWLAEGRTPGILRAMSGGYPAIAKELATKRPLLKLLPDCTDDELSNAFGEEENREKEADRAYWRPLIEELERLRHGR